MPMPEMPDEMGSSFLQMDHLEAWEKDREACYAAGKADALPPWPPEEGYYENYRLVRGTEMSEEEEFGKNIICPWCKHENMDTWEYGMQDNCFLELECQSCDQPISVYCTVSVDYTTTKRLDNEAQNGK